MNYLPSEPHEIAYYCIQCTADNGEVGDFVTKSKGKEDRTPISPVFDGLVQLYAWMRENGWFHAEYDRTGNNGVWNRIARLTPVMEEN